jgi:hypothetical protein
MESQLARWQDLRDGGGFGIAVKLFFVTLEKVLPTSSLEISQHDLYIDAFKSITSSWKMCRDTGRSRLSSTLFLTSLCDSPNFRPPRLRFRLSEDFTENLLELLRNMLDGQTGPHIDEAGRGLVMSVATSG